MAFGVTPTGFVTKTQATILAEIEADQLAEIDPALDVSADQPIGQINGIMSRLFAELWELGGAVYATFDRDKAEGDALEALAKLTGSTKRAALGSSCFCTVVLTAGATITPDVHFIQLDTDPSVQFTPVTEFTQAAAGTYTNVRFIAQNPGPLDIPANRLTVIGTPVSGWLSVTNTTTASGGHAADGDPQLRLTMDQDVAATGTSTVDAIRADLLELGQTTDPLKSVPQLQSVHVFENVTDAVVDGLPPHSFEALVYDGDSPDPGNADKIAQAIWDAKPAGIRSFGTTSGTALDSLNVAQTVAFSRVTLVPIYLTFGLTTDAAYSSHADFQTFIANFANAAFAAAGPGTDVVRSKAIAVAFVFPGVDDVVTLTLGITASPAGTANIPIGPRELARFDAARVVNI